ncbi:MAG: DegT/DnrJ/EryC1/StrS family aminotransferase [Phycisphaerae bacterium]
MMIPLVDLKAQYRDIQPEIDAAVAAVLADCGFVKGPRVTAFEERFAAYCDAASSVGTSSGTAALHLALAALGVGPGDEVIAPAHTFIATVEPISQLGARIVFADVDPATYTLDPESVERCITARTRVILPVHLYGQMADMEGLRACCGREICIVEDAAQACGAGLEEGTKGEEGTEARRHEGRGRDEGTGGRRDGVESAIRNPQSSILNRQSSIVNPQSRAVCFSFFPGKNLGAYGDAGAVVTSDNNLAQRMRKLRDHGRQDKHRHDLMGYNYRLDALQAAILQVKLPHLDEWNRRRRSRAALYNEMLGGVPGVTIPAVAAGRRHVYHLYVIQVDDRDGLRRFLADRRIVTGIHYPIALHQQPALQQAHGLEEGTKARRHGGTKGIVSVGFGSDALPVTERLVGRILSLPMFPEMTHDQVAEVADAVHAFQTRRKRRRDEGRKVARSKVGRSKVRRALDL